MGIGSKPVRVLSERIMSRGFEPTVVRLMEQVRALSRPSGVAWIARYKRSSLALRLGFTQVQKVVKSQPGLLAVETLSDVNDHHKYVVLSEVRRV